jgi:hypothetical protein
MLEFEDRRFVDIGRSDVGLGDVVQIYGHLACGCALRGGDGGGNDPLEIT